MGRSRDEATGESGSITTGQTTGQSAVTAMDETTRHRIRHIFRSPRPNFPLMTAAELLGMTLGELKREVEVGAIVAVSTSLGRRVAREELVAADGGAEQLVFAGALFAARHSPCVLAIRSFW